MKKQMMIVKLGFEEDFGEAGNAIAKGKKPMCVCRSPLDAPTHQRL